MPGEDKSSSYFHKIPHKLIVAKSKSIRCIGLYFYSCVLHATRVRQQGWMLWMMGRAGQKNPNNRDFQFWQQNNEPIELITNVLLNNTLHYTHQNPAEGGFVPKESLRDK
jgi:hypothetical protein